MQSYVLYLFLLGAYAGRRGFLTDVNQHLPFIRKVMWWTFCLGVPASLAVVVSQELSARGLPAISQRLLDYSGFLETMAHALFYLSALTLLLQKECWLYRFRPLAYAGRMALTNYLAQTLIWMPLYMAWGFGLEARFSASLSIVMTVIIFSLQVMASVWWLRRFRFGPMEWLWRSLTYWRMQPMRQVSHA